jgi:hypothetical protein
VRRFASVRSGELLALAGAACVGVSLGLPWYDGPRGSGAQAGAWATFGAGLALMILSAALAVGLVLANLRKGSPAIPVAAAVWSSAFGIVGTVAALVRVLDRPAGSAAVAIGGWLGLAGALAILAGSWQSMRDERTEIYPLPDLPPALPPPAASPLPARRADADPPSVESAP